MVACCLAKPPRIHLFFFPPKPALPRTCSVRRGVWLFYVVLWLFDVVSHPTVSPYLPRIPFSPSEEEIFPFKLKRKRFPMRLSFAMTINKAHGQTIPNVGVYLSDSGQLYVALFSRISRKTTKVLMNLVQEFSQEGVYTSTVMYQGVLRDK